MLKTTLLLVAGFAGVQLMSAKVDLSPARDADYVKQIESGRAQRVRRLQAPDGWLSLIGLHWLKDGRNTVGSAKDNDVVLAKGPAHLGVVTLTRGHAAIELAAGVDATIDGRKLRSAELQDDTHEQPTKIAFGTVSFHLIDRGGRKGLRVKDSDAETRTHFLGIDYFPIDPSWRVEAKWVPFVPAHTLEIPTVLGTVDKMPVPGKAVFVRDGKTYELLPVLEEPDAKQLWFIFADRTTGKQSYGAGRFLYADLPKDGTLTIDFNQAYNPPCAFTPYATCPLAPPENRLGVAVEAGEKKYRGGHH